MNLDPEAVLIVNALSSNRFSIEPHAKDRMNERGVQRQDIVEVGRNYYDCVRQDSGRYRIWGDDLSDEPLDVVCVYEGEAVVITVMGE